MAREHAPQRYGRRMFLQAAAGLAGTYALASCATGNAATRTAASCVTGLRFPAESTAARGGEVVSKVPNVPPAWTKYPDPYTSWKGDPPGRGGPVTAFEILWGAPPPQLGQNQWWQQLNKRLGATWQPVLADAPDYPDKLSTLAASGSFPDITYINLVPGISSTNGASSKAFQKIVDEGAFHDLTAQLTGSALKRFPNLQRLPELSWKGAAFEGKIYGPPYPIPPVDTLCCYRKDWAQKLGVDGPKNAADIKKMFLAFSHAEPGKQTWGIAAMDYTVWNYVFRAPNNWRLNKDGSLTHMIETEEYKAAVDFAIQLWKGGAYHPDSPINNYNRVETLLTGGQLGYWQTAPITFMGKNGMINKVAAATPGAQLAPLTLPGHDGGKWAVNRGASSYGFFAIPTSVKDEARITELLHILDWWSAPFGSDEYTFIVYGIDGLMYTRDDGAPVPTTDTALLALSSGLNYMDQPLEINFYYPGYGAQAKLAQTMQEQMIEGSVPDPTVGLYSPTDVAQGGNLTQLIHDTYNAIVVGRKPLSALGDLVSQWKSQGGSQSRKEFQQAMQKCK